MKIGAIIQARSNSKRLKNKHFYKVKNHPIIYQLIKRLKKIKKIKKIILATTINKSDNKFFKIQKRYGLKIFRGSEKDCLRRVYLAAKKFKLDHIVFVTGDCPIFDYKILSNLIHIYFEKNYDYAGNSFIRSFPDGMDVHIFSFETLKYIHRNCLKPLEREHVTLGIKRNSNKFKIYNMVSDKKSYWPNLGLTLDEYQDYVLINKIVEYFYLQKKYLFSCLDVIKLMKRKKKWQLINSSVLRKGES